MGQILLNILSASKKDVTEFQTTLARINSDELRGTVTDFHSVVELLTAVSSEYYSLVIDKLDRDYVSDLINSQGTYFLRTLNTSLNIIALCKALGKKNLESIFRKTPLTSMLDVNDHEKICQVLPPLLDGLIAVNYWKDPVNFLETFPQSKEFQKIGSLFHKKTLLEIFKQKHSEQTGTPINKTPLVDSSHYINLKNTRELISFLQKNKTCDQLSEYNIRKIINTREKLTEILNNTPPNRYTSLLEKLDKHYVVDLIHPYPTIFLNDLTPSKIRGFFAALGEQTRSLLRLDSFNLQYTITSLTAQKERLSNFIEGLIQTGYFGDPFYYFFRAYQHKNNFLTLIEKEFHKKLIIQILEEKYPELLLLSGKFKLQPENEKEILFQKMDIDRLAQVFICSDDLSTLAENTGKQHFLKIMGFFLSQKDSHSFVFSRCNSDEGDLVKLHPELALMFDSFATRDPDEKTRLLNAMRPESLHYLIPTWMALYNLYCNVGKDDFTRVVKKIDINHLEQLIRSDDFLAALSTDNDNDNDNDNDTILFDLIGTSLIARLLIEKSNSLSPLFNNAKAFLPAIQKIIRYLNKRSAMPDEFLSALTLFISSAPTKNAIVENFYPALDFTNLYKTHKLHAFSLFPLFVEKMPFEERDLFLTEGDYKYLILNGSVLNYIFSISPKDKMIVFLRNLSLDQKREVLVEQKYLFPLIQNWGIQTKQELQILLAAIGIDLVRNCFSDAKNQKATAALLNSLPNPELIQAFFNQIDPENPQQEIPFTPSLFNYQNMPTQYLNKDVKRSFAFAGYSLIYDALQAKSLSMSDILDWFAPPRSEEFAQFMDLFTKKQWEYLFYTAFIHRIQYNRETFSPFVVSQLIDPAHKHYRFFSMYAYFFAIKSAVENYLCIHHDSTSSGYKRAQGLLAILNSLKKPVLTSEVLFALKDIAEKSGQFIQKNSLQTLLVTALNQLPSELRITNLTKLIHAVNYWQSIYGIDMSNKIALTSEVNDKVFPVKIPVIPGFISSFRKTENPFAKIKTESSTEDEGEEMQERNKFSAGQ